MYYNLSTQKTITREEYIKIERDNQKFLKGDLKDISKVQMVVKMG